MADLDGIRCIVLHSIADHRATLSRIPIPLKSIKCVQRTGWIYKKASWQSLQKDLSSYDWSPLHRGTAEDAANYFCESLYMHLLMHIQRKVFWDNKHSHPWITQACEEAIAHKNSCEGTPAFSVARDRCTQIINQAYQDHVARLKAKIAALPKGSKQWWKLNRQLLHKKCRTSSIPRLRVEKK